MAPPCHQLARGEVWIAAASQIFYSTGVGWGTLVAFASYNDRAHNFVRDAWMVPLINCAPPNPTPSALRLDPDP